MRRRKKKNYLILLLLLVLTLGIGYALISTNLTINGIGKFNNQSWNVHFEDLTYNPGNVTLSQGDAPASINQTTMTDISFTVTLQEPGDFYEFEVAAVNSGTMDAMVGLVTNNLNGNPISSTNQLPAYARYTATYSDGIEIAPNHLLEAGYSETYKVRVEYRTDIDPEDLPDEVEELSFTFGVQYVQADSNAIERPLPKILTLSASIINEDELIYGEQIYIEVNTDEDFEGQVSVLVNQRTYTAPFSDGKTIVSIPQSSTAVDGFLPGGENTIVITAIPSDLTQYYSIPTVNLTINIAPDILDPDEIKSVDQGGGLVTIVVPEDVEGVITLTLDENHIYNETIENGIAVFEIDSSVPEGQYNVVILFTPSNLNYTSASKTTRITI